MLDKYIIQFTNNIDGLRDFIELIGPIVNHNHETAVEARKKITSSFDLAKEIVFSGDEEEKRDKEEKIKLLLDGELVKAEKVELTEEELKHFPEGEVPTFMVMVPAAITGKVEEAMSGPTKTRNQKQLLYTNSLIGLLSSVEWFYSQVLHYYYDKFPSAAGIKKKTLTLEDLKTFASVEDAEKYLIDNKIEEIFRGGFENWISIIRDEIKLKVNFIKPFEDELLEVYQRRNILVHNGGIINSIYFAKVPPSARGKKKIGDRIYVTETYLENAICKLHLVFTLIAAELWKKLEPKEKMRGELLNDIAYSNMLHKRWVITEGLSNFIKTDNDLPSVIKTVGQLNYWLCKKRNNKYQEIKSDLEKADFSDKSLRYQLAMLALKDDKENFFIMLPDTLKTKSLGLNELMDFPIFEEMRMTEEFKKFKETSLEFKEFVNFDTKLENNDSRKETISEK